jgi:CBS domain-containing protein/sporulation protein YlmC with PRC-barrel domain
MATYLSSILGKPVWDSQGERLGHCVDVLMGELETAFPSLRAIAVASQSKPVRLVAADDIAWLCPSIILKTAAPTPYEPRGGELWLARNVLDRQIVDTEGRRLVRVNDLQIARVGTSDQAHYCLAGVDIGTRGLLRRLGVERPLVSVLKRMHREPKEAVVPWNDVAPLQTDEPLRLRISRERIGELHPVDIAAIVSELDRPTGQALLNTLDTETIADTMEEIEPGLQVSMLDTLAPERAADVLEEMGPDEAADLLADLQPHERAKLLDLMEHEDALDVQKLLAYPENTAGGIMTTEFVTIPMGLTVAEALDALRKSPAAAEDEALYSVYIVDPAQRLQGVIALRELVLKAPETPVGDFMETDIITVEPLTPQDEVAHLVARYNLLAVPVVDQNSLLLGIVTVDDALDAIIPTAWKKRLPRFF